MNRVSRRGSAGFSLLELLVVIAVILILARMLLPALDSARRKAWGVVCGNNLHQLWTAMRIYSEDWKVWPARGEINENFGDSIWVGLQLPVGNPAVSATKPIDPTRGALAKYLNHSGKYGSLFMCPATQDGYLRDIKTSYVMNGQVGNFRKPGSIRDTAGVYLFVETRWDPFPTPNDVSHVCSGADKAALVHDGGGFHAFADGHVVWKRASIVDNDFSSCIGMNVTGPSAPD